MKAPLLTLTCAFISASLMSCDRQHDYKPITLTDSVEIERAGLNGNKWRTAFDISLNDKQLIIILRIRLAPGPRISQPQLDRLQSSWESAVEAVWSNKFALVISEISHPIKLDLKFTRLAPQHTVIVRDEASHRVDQLNWSRWSSGVIIAHEIGHMLGAYDEYSGGGQDPLNPTTSHSSLMGGTPGPEAQLSEHHFKVIESWAQDKFDDARIVSVRDT